MSWFGTVIGGAFGFFLGGPLGAVLGASVGHKLSKGLDDVVVIETLNSGDHHKLQMAFFTATYSVMGHVAKTDGHVSSEEISQASRIMDEMALSKEMRTTAINLFQQGKQADFPLDEVLAQFYKECHQRTELIHMFLRFQLLEAFADGYLVVNEERLLLHICRQLRISRFDYERIKIQLLAQQRFQKSNSSFQNAPKKNNLQEAYHVLGLTPSASKADVKKAYRRLMSQNHPDKLAAKGLSEEMMRKAKEKTQKISKAYETIQKMG